MTGETVLDEQGTDVAVVSRGVLGARDRASILRKGVAIVRAHAGEGEQDHDHGGHVGAGTVDRTALPGGTPALRARTGHRTHDELLVADTPRRSSRHSARDHKEPGVALRRIDHEQKPTPL
jgi:hypothetical protein